MAFFDGRWVRSKTDWREYMSNKELELFNELNHSVLEEYGYL